MNNFTEYPLHAHRETKGKVLDCVEKNIIVKK